MVARQRCIMPSVIVHGVMEPADVANLKLLLDAGANVNIRDIDDKTPLQFAETEITDADGNVRKPIAEEAAELIREHMTLPESTFGGLKHLEQLSLAE